MGNRLGKRSHVVDDYTRPKGLYQHKDVDFKKLRKLILEGHIAPCYRGDDERGSDLEECPICFLYYPSLNRSFCCMKAICTGLSAMCYPVNRIVFAVGLNYARCPFCKALDYGVVYLGAKTKDEKDLEQIEEQRVIEAMIRMRQQELQDGKNKILERTEISSLNSIGLSFPSAVESEGNSSVHRAASTTAVHQRQNGHNYDHSCNTFAMPKSQVGANIQDVVVHGNPRNMEVKDVVGTTILSQDGNIRIPETISVSQKWKEFLQYQASDLGMYMSRDFPTTSGVSYVVDEAGLFSEDGAAKEKVDNIAQNSSKHGTGKAVDTSTLAVSQQPPAPSAKEEKQKGKNPHGSSSSSAPLRVFSSSTPHGAAEKISSLQETLNQLITMKLESQKQMETMVTAKVANEGKRIEKALEKNMEEVVEDSCDALWACFQEDNVKREKASEEHTRQVITAVNDCLNSDLTEIIEKTIRRELTAAIQVVAETVNPSIEETISSSIAECFQDGVGDKVVNQVEKLVNSKLEATVSRQIQAQFQTPGNQVLQEMLKSSFEGSMIPAFEMSCRAMFEQVDTTFQKRKLEHTAAAQQQLEASHSPLAIALTDAINSASSMTEALSNEMLDSQRNFVALTENSISANPRSQLTIGPSVGLHQNIGIPFDPTKELLRLISECKYEEAFRTGLQRSDTTIASWLCYQVDLPKILTLDPLPLSQVVLLSLLQQLACDISKETSRKLTWMMEVLSVLYPADPVIAIHIRPILEQVHQILNHHIHNPSISGIESSNIRFIRHVINSMLMTLK